MSLSGNTEKITELLSKINALPEETTPSYQEKTVTPSTSAQTVTPDSGYDALSQVTVNGDANLLAENIKSGVSIFDVLGTLASGGGSELQVAVGTFNPTSLQLSTTPINITGLGFKPKYVFIHTYNSRFFLSVSKSKTYFVDAFYLEESNDLYGTEVYASGATKVEDLNLRYIQNYTVSVTSDGFVLSSNGSSAQAWIVTYQYIAIG